jgi:hypothetical protein
MVGEHFGEADLAGVGFAHANLNRADLSAVTGLTSEAVAADAIVEEATKWPKGFFPPDGALVQNLGYSE